MIWSLAMRFEIKDGSYVVHAPWLDSPVKAATWREAYDLAMALRP